MFFINLFKMGNTDAENREMISSNIIQTYNACEAECKTVEDLNNKIEDGQTEKIKDLIKNKEEMKNHYTVEKERFMRYFETKLENEELKRKQQTPEVRYEYYESEESKYYRRQKQIEEQNIKTASEELPNFLAIVKNDFFKTLDNKVLNIKENIEKALSNYTPDNLKILLQKIAENEKLNDKLIEYIKKESEKIMEKSFKNSNHFNTLLLGKTGVGKSTLINGTFGFAKNEGAKTGIGEPITKEFGEYTSDKRKGLRLIDSQGIELEGHNIEVVFNSAKKLIEDRAREGDPDKLIHCIWYCFKSSGLRFENCEKEILTLLMNQYDDNNLPIIVVITQNFIEEDTVKMIDYLKKEFQFLNREIIIIPVVALKKNLGNKKKELIVEEDGIEELIKVSFEKSQKAILPAFVKSIKEKIIKIFSQNIESKKNILKNILKELIKNILRKIKEKAKIEKNISKISSIIGKTLNIFFEFTINIEKENIVKVENKEIKEAKKKEEEEKENMMKI